jgi:cystathionine beta-lyase/cystathionine gamma-synthase
MTPRTRMVYVETPSNPLMEITDIAGAAELAHAGDAVLAVDNTFMSPYHQQPLALGADYVVHSTTKFLNGHSDSVGGVLVAAPAPSTAEWFAFVQKSAGGVLAPFDSFLVLRGIKTLAGAHGPPRVQRAPRGRPCSPATPGAASVLSRPARPSRPRGAAAPGARLRRR